jgi:hypothetical protein
MASQYYLEGDYIRDYNDFLDYRKNNGVKFWWF